MSQSIETRRMEISKSWAAQARRSHNDGMHILADTCQQFALQALDGYLDPPAHYCPTQYQLATSL